MSQQVPLQLESYFVENLTFHACQGFDRTRPPNEVVHVESAALQHQHDASRFMTRMHVSVGQANSGNPRCQLNLDLVGFFVLPSEVTGGLRAMMITQNAPSILYGVARQLVVETTSNGPWGKVFIGTANFAAAAGGKVSATHPVQSEQEAPIVSDKPATRPSKRLDRV